MHDKINTYKAVQYAYINVQQNEDGELIARPDKQKSLGIAGPSNVALQTVEVYFPESLSYPYTFSVVCANMAHGTQGEGSYAV